MNMANLRFWNSSHCVRSHDTAASGRWCKGEEISDSLASPVPRQDKPGREPVGGIPLERIWSCVFSHQAMYHCTRISLPLYEFYWPRRIPSGLGGVYRSGVGYAV